MEDPEFHWEADRGGEGNTPYEACLDAYKDDDLFDKTTCTHWGWKIGYETADGYIAAIDLPATKKKYTIVYGDWFSRGSVRCSITKYDRVETDNLSKLIKEDTKYSGNVWFIFDGWCKESHET